MKRLSLAFIAAACLALIVYVIWAERHDRAEFVVAELIFPRLLDQLNSTTQIDFVTSQMDIAIKRTAGQWSIVNHYDYAADIRKVRAVLIGLAQMRFMDRVTRNANQHATLGVANVFEPDSPALHLTLRKDQDVLADIIVGRSRKSASVASLTEYYVRFPGDSEVWVAEGSLPKISDSLDWLDRRIADIERERIETVRVEGKNSIPLRLRRSPQDVKNFDLPDIPNGKEIRFQYRVNSIAGMLRKLAFEDVVPADSFETGIRFEIRTFDGLIVQGEVSDDGARYATFSAMFEEHASEAVQQEAAQLANRWDGWAYQLSESRFKLLNFTFEDLVKDASNG